jgi:UDP-glucose 4-epimerase
MPLTAGSPLAPISAYGKSKFHAEQAIANGLKDSSLIWGIFRPVLVFGPHNPGNMARLEGLIRRRLPVPVGLQPNRRSFLFVGNLISAIQAFLNADAPPSGKAWVVADQDYCSTADLVHWMGQAMGMPSRVLPIPDKVLHVLGSVGDILGKIGVPSPWNSTVAHKLLGSFYADTSPLQEDLIWKAPWTTKEGIQETYQSHIADPSIPGQDHRPSNGAKE